MSPIILLPVLLPFTTHAPPLTISPRLLPPCLHHSEIILTAFLKQAKMPQYTLNAPTDPNKMWTERNFPFPYIKAKLDDLHNMIFKCGCITKIHHGGGDAFPHDTLLKILDKEGHEYYFRGPGAYDAVYRADRPVWNYQDVHFFANEETKAVVYML